MGGFFAYSPQVKRPPSGRPGGPALAIQPPAWGRIGKSPKEALVEKELLPPLSMLFDRAAIPLTTISVWSEA